MLDKFQDRRRGAVRVAVAGALLASLTAVVSVSGGQSAASATTPEVPCTAPPGPVNLGNPNAPVGVGAPALVTRPAVRKSLRSNNSWFLDQSGRVVFLHGTNMVNKLAPYTPSNVGFGIDDATAIKKAGWNAVRLGFTWKALEPKPGVYDDRYLADFAGTVKLLTDRGIQVLVDAHQDMYNEEFAGQGFPDWATHSDGIPAVPNCGFPMNYFVMPAMWRAWDHLWANDVRDSKGRTLWQAYAQMWQHVALQFRDDKNVFGYDLINEPFPGSTLPLCINPLTGCPIQDKKVAQFQAYVTKAVRAVDPNTTVFYEPWVPYDFGVPSSMPNPVGSNAGFSFHSYCLAAQSGLPQLPVPPELCNFEENLAISGAVRRRNAGQGVPLLSEFGASSDPTVMTRVANSADKQLVSWLHWAWYGKDPSGDRPNEGIVIDPTLPPTGSNLHADRLKALTRPYAQAVAGTPTASAYNPTTRTFTLTYNTQRVGSLTRFPAGSVTLVAVPAATFPAGFSVVNLSGARIVNPSQPVIQVVSQAGARTVTLTIKAR